MWPTSSAGEREVLDQDVGGCDQGRAAGAVLAEQWTGKHETLTHTFDCVYSCTLTFIAFSYACNTCCDPAKLLKEGAIHIAHVALQRTFLNVIR